MQLSSLQAPVAAKDYDLYAFQASGCLGITIVAFICVQRPESEIAVVSHSSILHHALANFVDEAPASAKPDLDRLFGAPSHLVEDKQDNKGCSLACCKPCLCVMRLHLQATTIVSFVCEADVTRNSGVPSTNYGLQGIVSCGAWSSLTWLGTAKATIKPGGTLMDCTSRAGCQMARRD